MEILKNFTQKGEEPYPHLEVKGGGNWVNRDCLQEGEGEVEVETTFTSPQDSVILFSEPHAPTDYINMMS